MAGSVRRGDIRGGGVAGDSLAHEAIARTLWNKRRRASNALTACGDLEVPTGYEL